MCIPSLVYNELTPYDIPIAVNITTTNQSLTMISYNTTLTRTLCHAQFPSYKIDKIFTTYAIFLSYLLPVIIIFLCYTRIMIKFLFNKKNKRSLTEENKRFELENVKAKRFRFNKYTSNNFLSGGTFMSRSLKNDTSFKYINHSAVSATNNPKSFKVR